MGNYFSNTDKVLNSTTTSTHNLYNQFSRNEDTNIICTYKPKKIELSEGKCYLHLLPKEIICSLCMFISYQVFQIVILLNYDLSIVMEDKIDIPLLRQLCRDGNLKILEEDLNLGLKLDSTHWQILLHNGSAEIVNWMLQNIKDVSKLKIGGNLDKEQITKLLRAGAKIEENYYLASAIRFRKIDNIDFLITLRSNETIDLLVNLRPNEILRELYNKIIRISLSECNFEVFSKYIGKTSMNLSPNMLTEINRITLDFHNFVMTLEPSDEQIFSLSKPILHIDVMKLGYKPSHKYLHKFFIDDKIEGLQYRQCCVAAVAKNSYSEDCMIPSLMKFIENKLDIKYIEFFVINEEITNFLLHYWVPTPEELTKIIKLYLEDPFDDKTLAPLFKKVPLNLEHIKATEKRKSLLNLILSHADGYISNLYKES